MAKDVVSDYLDEEKERLKQIITDPFKQVVANFVDTLTLPQTKKPKKVYPKDDRPILQVIDEILKGE